MFLFSNYATKLVENKTFTHEAIFVSHSCLAHNILCSLGRATDIKQKIPLPSAIRLRGGRNFPKFISYFYFQIGDELCLMSYVMSNPPPPKPPRLMPRSTRLIKELRNFFFA